MSATAQSSLDIQEQVARIDRAIAETHKLQQESDKFSVEQRKLAAEADKFKVDRFIAPVIAIASFVVAIASYYSTVSRRVTMTKTWPV